MSRSLRQHGFTLIEMIVSLALFAGVITIAVGALLVLVAANDQLQGEQSVMINLSFALDSMTREIRTGTNYLCASRTNYSSGGTDNLFQDGNDLDLQGDATADCQGKFNPNWDLHGMSFIESGDSVTGATAERIVYFHDSNDGKVYRRVGAGNAVSILADDIYVHDFQFFVTGSIPQSVGAGLFYDQASVTVYMEASPTSSTPVDERYRLQSTVTQRILDI
jgi:prepilin-type N-terminal cleavage/methylation domain-containing protein